MFSPEQSTGGQVPMPACASPTASEQAYSLEGRAGVAQIDFLGGRFFKSDGSPACSNVILVNQSGTGTRSPRWPARHKPNFSTQTRPPTFSRKVCTQPPYECFSFLLFFICLSPRTSLWADLPGHRRRCAQNLKTPRHSVTVWQFPWYHLRCRQPSTRQLPQPEGRHRWRQP